MALEAEVAAALKRQQDEHVMRLAGARAAHGRAVQKQLSRKSNEALEAKEALTQAHAQALAKANQRWATKLAEVEAEKEAALRTKHRLLRELEGSRALEAHQVQEEAVDAEWGMLTPPTFSATGRRSSPRRAHSESSVQCSPGECSVQ